MRPKQLVGLHNKNYNLRSAMKDNKFSSDSIDGSNKFSKKDARRHEEILKKRRLNLNQLFKDSLGQQEYER